jgi:hypothetical protein
MSSEVWAKNQALAGRMLQSGVITNNWEDHEPRQLYADVRPDMTELLLRLCQCIKNLDFNKIVLDDATCKQLADLVEVYHESQSALVEAGFLGDEPDPPEVLSEAPESVCWCCHKPACDCQLTGPYSGQCVWCDSHKKLIAGTPAMAKGAMWWKTK